MQIDLSKVLAQEGRQQRVKVELSQSAFICAEGEFPYTKKQPIELAITHTGNQVLHIQTVKSALDCEEENRISVQIPCSRCLEPVEIDFDIEIDEEVDMKRTDQERIDDLDESCYIQDKVLDTDRLLYNEILIRWPMQVLCKEDCKGICSRCGANLNRKLCDCDTADLDPRMAVISDIFKNFKEV